MTTESVNIFQGKFGFHPCDRPTLKKIKRIRDLIEKCKGRNNRFRWFHRKAPQNRIARTPDWKGAKHVTFVYKKVEEPKLFELFFARVEVPMSHQFEYRMRSCGYHRDQFRFKVEETQAYRDFMATYKAARSPAAKSPEGVTRLLHTPEQIDAILDQIELYHTA
jgi:hypothetical protein